MLVTVYHFELPVLHSNFPFAIILHMVIYLFQCYSFNLSHLLSLPLHPRCVQSLFSMSESLLPPYQQIHVVVWQKPIQCCKAIILHLKVNKFKLKTNKQTKKQKRGSRGTERGGSLPTDTQLVSGACNGLNTDAQRSPHPNSWTLQMLLRRLCRSD